VCLSLAAQTPTQPAGWQQINKLIIIALACFSGIISKYTVQHIQWPNISLKKLVYYFSSANDTFP